MLIYKNTFNNIKTCNCNFPIEDQYFANENEAIVADGITRDPIGVKDLSLCSPKEFIEKYPRPSGASLVAKLICDTFSKTDGELLDRLIKCNSAVKELNDKSIIECDYLENDYYGAVASCINIKDNILNYAYICDCGVIIYDENGTIKFQTEDDKKLYSDPYRKVKWHLPEGRVTVRKDYRNNLSKTYNGKCISFGALTGEEAAKHFMKTGKIALSDGDLILVYSDGLSNFLHDRNFILQIINFEKDSFEKYIGEKSQSDFEKYGKEKTIVLYKYCN